MAIKETEAFSIIDAGMEKYNTVMPDWTALKLQAATERSDKSGFKEFSIRLGHIIPVSASGLQMDLRLSNHPKDSIPPDDNIYHYDTIQSDTIAELA